MLPQRFALMPLSPHSDSRQQAEVGPEVFGDGWSRPRPEGTLAGGAVRPQRQPSAGDRRVFSHTPLPLTPVEGRVRQQLNALEGSSHQKKSQLEPSENSCKKLGKILQKLLKLLAGTFAVGAAFFSIWP